MAKFYFERECRTANSECFTVLREEEALGRVDIHFADSVVHATLSIAESLTTDEIQDLIDTIDEELLDSVGITRQEVIVHVHQGRDLGVFSTRNFEGNGGHHGNGGHQQVD
jgi:type II secretory pathway component HofQ